MTPTADAGWTAPPRGAAAIWLALNARQQFYLKTICDEDQARERARREAAAVGEWDSTPAGEWRAINAYHRPATDLVPLTGLQMRWHGAGHRDQHRQHHQGSR